MSAMSNFAEAEARMVTGTPLIRAQFGPMHAGMLDWMEFHTILLYYLKKPTVKPTIATKVYNIRRGLFSTDHDESRRSLQSVRGLIEVGEDERVSQCVHTVPEICVY
ncbi:hypothetical protein J1614_008837 [Plenodomus biglobosus]|nr:hypothetical protein J1614_008837 [Plenodomus biglobosus]